MSSLLATAGLRFLRRHPWQTWLTVLGVALGVGVVIAVGSAYEYLSLLRGGMSAALRRYVTVSYHAGNREQARKYYSAGFWWASLLRSVILLAGVLLAGSTSGMIMSRCAPGPWDRFFPRSGLSATSSPEITCPKIV